MMQRFRLARRFEPVVQKDQRVLVYGEWERTPELRVHRRRDLRVRRPRLGRIQVSSPVEPVGPMAGVRDLRNHRVSELMLTAEIPMVDEGVLEAHLERVRPGCKRSNRRIIQQIADEPFRWWQTELEGRQRLLIFANPGEVLDRILVIADRDGVEEEPVPTTDDCPVVDAIGGANARPEVVLLGLGHRPGYFAASDHDPWQLVYVQVVEREREIE